MSNCDAQVEFFVTRLEALWSDKCRLIQENAELKLELLLLKQQLQQQPKQPEEPEEPEKPEKPEKPVKKLIKVIKNVPSMVA